MLLVKCIVLVSLLRRSITADRRNIYHAVPGHMIRQSSFILLKIGSLVVSDHPLLHSQTHLNSTNVPLLIGMSSPAMYIRHQLTNFLYLSSPSHLMKLFDSSGSPSRNAVSPFSEKQKSKRDVTFMLDVPSCSCCFARSEPPTKPIAHLCRRAERRESISGEADLGEGKSQLAGSGEEEDLEIWDSLQDGLE